MGGKVLVLVWPGKGTDGNSWYRCNMTACRMYAVHRFVKNSGICEGVQV